MTRETPTKALEPQYITVRDAQNRLQDIKDLVESDEEGTNEMAQIDRAHLYLNVLYSIATAPAIADKREMKRLAVIALEAMEIPITPRADT